MQHASVNFNQVPLVLLMAALPLILVCRKGSDSPPEDALESLLNSGGFKLVDEVPLQFPTYHVQGLDLTEQSYFVTSVDPEQGRG